MCLVLVVGVSGLAAYAQTSAPSVQGHRSATGGDNPRGFVLRYISSDPTAELVEQVGLSAEQTAFVASKYREYLECIDDIGRRIREKYEAQPDWSRRHELTGAQAGELINRVYRASQSLEAETVGAEECLFDEINAIIAEAQWPAYRRTTLTIRRREWLGSGQMRQQDFSQFRDPVDVVLPYRSLLGPRVESLAAFDGAVEQFGEQMKDEVPEWVLSRHASRQELRSALAAGDRDRVSRARAKHTRHWLRMYAALSAFMDQVSATMKDAGEPQAAMEMYEEFWRGAFPDLVGHEELALAVRCLDQPQALADVCRQYVTRRHDLLARATAAHVADFREIDGAYLPPAFGASSAEVLKLQIQRCVLSLETRAVLSKIIASAGGFPPEWYEIEADTRRSAAGRGYSIFDSEQTLAELQALRATFSTPKSQPNSNSPHTGDSP